MIRNDGIYTIYMIQHQWKDKPRWETSIENIMLFPASDTCWQQTGVHGTYSEEKAKEAFRKLVPNANQTYRIAKVSISQKTEEV